MQKIVTNERYQGVLIWGRTGNKYVGGTRVEITRPDAEVVRVVKPELRIIDDELWQRAQAKSDHVRSSTGLSKTGGRPKFLLAGLARCGECGGPVRALHRRRGTVTIRAYGCAWRDERGPAVCGNSIRRPVEVVDEAILGWVRENILGEALANARVVAAAPTLRWAEVEAAARARLADLRGLAAGDVDAMREVLQRLMVGPMKFHPVRHSPRNCSFRITGAVVGGRGLMASPEGTGQNHVASKPLAGPQIRVAA